MLGVTPINMSKFTSVYVFHAALIVLLKAILALNLKKKYFVVKMCYYYMIVLCGTLPKIIEKIKTRFEILSK